MLKVLSFTGLFLYCGFIYWLSDQSSLPVPMLFPHQDKLFHAGAYFIMAILAWASFRHLTSKKRVFLISVIFCSLYGGTDEWHQSFVEGRFADVADWLADTLGAMIAMIMLHQLIPRFLKSEKTKE